MLRKETKIFSIIKDDRYLPGKNNDPCKTSEQLYFGKPFYLICDKGNNVGLNKFIVNIILASKRDFDFSSKLTIELYHSMIKNNYTWKVLRNILLNKSTFN